MSKNKAKKDNKLIKSEKEILSGILEDDNAYTLTIGIPGRGKIKLTVAFEREEDEVKLEDYTKRNKK